MNGDDDTNATSAFLARVEEAADDPALGVPELVSLILSDDNPLLADPAWQRVLALLERKRGGESLSAAQAAEEMGLTLDAVYKAIRAGRLAATKHGGGWAIDRASAASYRDRVAGGRGRPSTPALVVRRGSEPGRSLRLKAPTWEETGRPAPNIVEGVVPRFERAAVCFSEKSAGGRKSNRVFVLEPADELNEYTHGSFFIRGHYSVRAKENNAAEAARMFAEFEPA